MKILVAGTRGIPNIPGGVETHCEAIYPKLEELGLDITIARRTAYIPKTNKITTYKGIQLIDLYSPQKKSLEAIIHTFLATIYGKKKDFKYIHIHAIGPSLIIPFARLLGLKVIMTHHGPDYDRQKWGKLAKASLRLGEWCAAKFANEIIVISNTINSILKEKYNRVDAHLIPNGVTIPIKAISDSYIKSLGLQKQNYIIAVGRFVPEKGLHDLIEAYLKIKTTYKLVLVGDADHESDYSLSIKQKSQEHGIVLTGFIKGDRLNEIFSHASLFVMPSYHEGLPIALLEALSYDLKTVVSDIPANLEVDLTSECYFRTGSISDLSKKIVEQLESSIVPNYKDFLLTKFNWDNIAQATLEVYKKLES